MNCYTKFILVLIPKNAMLTQVLLSYLLTLQHPRCKATSLMCPKCMCYDWVKSKFDSSDETVVPPVTIFSSRWCKEFLFFPFIIIVAPQEIFSTPPLESVLRSTRIPINNDQVRFLLLPITNCGLQHAAFYSFRALLSYSANPRCIHFLCN